MRMSEEKKEGWRDWNKVRQREKERRKRGGRCLGITFSAGQGLKGNSTEGQCARRMKNWTKREKHKRYLLTHTHR